MSPSTFSKTQEQTLFAQLKEQIISLATALYGTHTSPSSFDVLTYLSEGDPDTEEPVGQCGYGIALITYLPKETGTGTEMRAGYTSWEVLSKTSGYETVNGGMEALLADLRVAVGGCAELERKDEVRVRHKRIPDLAVEGDRHGDLCGDVGTQ